MVGLQYRQPGEHKAEVALHHHLLFEVALEAHPPPCGNRVDQESRRCTDRPLGVGSRTCGGEYQSDPRCRSHIPPSLFYYQHAAPGGRLPVHPAKTVPGLHLAKAVEGLGFLPTMPHEVLSALGEHGQRFLGAQGQQGRITEDHRWPPHHPTLAKKMEGERGGHLETDELVPTSLPAKQPLRQRTTLPRVEPE